MKGLALISVRTAEEWPQTEVFGDIMTFYWNNKEKASLGQAHERMKEGRTGLPRVSRNSILKVSRR